MIVETSVSSSEFAEFFIKELSGCGEGLDSLISDGITVEGFFMIEAESETAEVDEWIGLFSDTEAGFGGLSWCFDSSLFDLCFWSDKELW